MLSLALRPTASALRSLSLLVLNMDKAEMDDLPAEALGKLWEELLGAARAGLAVAEGVDHILALALAEVQRAEGEAPAAPAIPRPANDHDHPTSPEQPGRPVA